MMLRGPALQLPEFRQHASPHASPHATHSIFLMFLLPLNRPGHGREQARSQHFTQAVTSTVVSVSLSYKQQAAPIARQGYITVPHALSRGHMAAVCRNDETSLGGHSPAKNGRAPLHAVLHMYATVYPSCTTIYIHLEDPAAMRGPLQMGPCHYRWDHAACQHTRHSGACRPHTQPGVVQCMEAYISRHNSSSACVAATPAAHVRQQQQQPALKSTHHTARRPPGPCRPSS
jgi:hypothetical protein